MRDKANYRAANGRAQDRFFTVVGLTTAGGKPVIAEGHPAVRPHGEHSALPQGRVRRLVVVGQWIAIHCNGMRSY